MAGSSLTCLAETVHEGEKPGHIVGQLLGEEVVCHGIRVAHPGDVVLVVLRILTPITSPSCFSPLLLIHCFSCQHCNFFSFVTSDCRMLPHCRALLRRMRKDLST